MKKHFIYLVENKFNGKLYIGQTGDLEERWKRHRRGKSFSKLLNRAVNKNGIEVFEFSLLECCFTQETANEREQFWIQELESICPNGYNLTRGGGGVSGYTFSEESKKRLSTARKGKKKSEETKRRISEGLKGEKSYMFGRHGELSPHFGLKRSPETLKKLSEAHKGYCPSQETREKLSKMYSGEGNPNFGKKHSPETIAKIKEAQKARWAIRKNQGLEK